MLRLERPAARNAMDTQMLAEIEHLRGHTRRRRGPGAGDQLLRPHGALRRRQHQGGDRRRAQGRADAALRRRLRPDRRLSEAGDCAVCHGDVVGGGAEVAIACDMRIGGSNLRMRFPGAALGVPWARRLVRPCGPRRRQVPALLLARWAPARPCGSAFVNRVARGRGQRTRRSSSATESRRPPRGGDRAVKRMLHSGTTWESRAPRARARSVAAQRPPASPGRDGAWAGWTGPDRRRRRPPGEIGKPFLAALEQFGGRAGDRHGPPPVRHGRHGWEKVGSRRGDVLDRDSARLPGRGSGCGRPPRLRDRRRRGRAARSTWRGPATVLRGDRLPLAPRRLVYASPSPPTGSTATCRGLLEEVTSRCTSSSRHPYSAHKAKVEGTARTRGSSATPKPTPTSSRPCGVAGPRARRRCCLRPDPARCAVEARRLPAGGAGRSAGAGAAAGPARPGVSMTTRTTSPRPSRPPPSAVANAGVYDLAGPGRWPRPRRELGWHWSPLRGWRSAPPPSCSPRFRTCPSRAACGSRRSAGRC